jgi:nucleoside-diphosphate-sugar epimerase
MNQKFWKNKKILITGAAFIGSHLVDKLISAGCDDIRITNLTNRNKKYFTEYIKQGKVKFHAMDLRNTDFARKAVHDRDIVFHLAAAHGGRGYVNTHQAATASNFLLDGSVFQACLKEKVKKVVFASSGCIYPNFLQQNTKKTIHLKEKMAGPPFDADNMYGWAKLMAEMSLGAFFKEYGLQSVILRYFTVYGPRAVENHAIMALIAKAFINQNPYEVWGDGHQIRNWTYVDDIVDGTILAAEKIGAATAINLGTQERITVNEAVRKIFQYFPKKKIKYFKNMPVGPVNRVASNKLARYLLDWESKVNFDKGLDLTIRWYIKNKNKKQVAKNFEKKLLEIL